MQQLKKLIEKNLSSYQKDFDVRTKKNSGEDEFNYGLKEDNFCDYWGLQGQYSDYKFLKKLTKKERDKLLLQYGIQRLLHYEEILIKRKYNRKFKLYITLEIDTNNFLNIDEYLWPGIYFCNNSECINKQNCEDEKVTLIKDSDRTKYIKILMNELNILQYFNMVESKFQYGDDEDEYTEWIEIDFKKKHHPLKILLS